MRNLIPETYFMYAGQVSDSIGLAVTNLTSVSVLVFALGFLAARFKSDIRIPEPVYQIISVYLLFGIGLKGGVSLSNSNGTGIVLPLIATVILGIIIPIFAFMALRFVKNLGEVDRGAISAHYGSTSLVTFTAALVFLENAEIYYEGFATTLLTVMEVPGIIVGIFLATRHLSRDVSWSKSLKEVVVPFLVVCATPFTYGLKTFAVFTNDTILKALNIETLGLFVD